MRWVKTKSGERAHAVHEGLTLCGMTLRNVTDVIGAVERCGNCDKEWRRRGRATKRKEPPKTKTKNPEIYKPQHTFADWDK